MKFCLASVFALGICLSAVAQYDTLIGKGHTEHYWVHRNYWLPKMLDPERDSAAIFKEIESVRILGEDHNDVELKMDAQLMELFFFIIVPNPPHPQVEPQFKNAYSKAEDLNLSWAKASIEREWGMHYLLRARNYELCFQHYYNMYDLVQNIGPDEFPEHASCLHDLAKAHYFFRDYEVAAKIYKEAVEAAHATQNYEFAADDLNSVGLCFQKANMLDSADHYFRKALELVSDTSISQMSHSFNGPAWVSIVSGNIGYNHYLRGEYDLAVPLLEKDLESALRSNDLGLAAGSLTPLGSINIEKGNLALAEERLLKARSYIKKVGQNLRLEALYPILTKLYTAKGDQELALLYLDSAMHIRDSLSLEFSKLQVSRIEQKLERERYESEVKILESERSRKVFQRNALVVLIILLMILAMVIYRSLQQRFRRKQHELKQAEEELSAARDQLDTFTKHLAEKNKASRTVQTEDQESALQEIQQMTILTPEDWAYFKQLFEKVHVGYLHRLRKLPTKLSPAETRFIALSKLNLTPKEMEGVLGVGPEAIRQYRLRLKKKLQLSDQSSLEDFIENV